jgi:hypothetical protein
MERSNAAMDETQTGDMNPTSTDPKPELGETNMVGILHFCGPMR